MLRLGAKAMGARMRSMRSLSNGNFSRASSEEEEIGAYGSGRCDADERALLA